MTVRIRDHDAGGFPDILCDDAGRNHPVVIRASAAHLGDRCLERSLVPYLSLP